ncbi:ribonuclease R [Clostridiales bacterium]|nr:ribonuclease R [Clostridiales bacterium]
MFFLMKELSDLLREKRKKRGSIDFDFPESKILLDKDGVPVSIKPYERNAATKLIEDFMLLANETVAQHFYWMELPFVYRTHDYPDPEKILKLGTFINNFGYHIKVKSGDNEIHPHLGKILISVGILLFGMNPFGWRFISVIFGILLIPLMYLFAIKIFKNTFIATAATGLLTFDCMHYTLSRIATIDIIAAFFILLMYYYMYRYFVEDSRYRALSSSMQDKFPPKSVYLPLALSGISMGLGIATKWTGVYAGAGLAVLFIWYTITHFPKKQTLKLFFFCCLFFIVVPLIMYTLCFIPVVGYSEYSGLIDKTIQGTKYMFDYHANLVAEHYYSSPFYEWPVIWMPLLDACDEVNASMSSCVSTMGNPAIWWFSIPCQLYVLFRWIFKRDQKAGFLCIAYLAQYVPWMSISRITFIYHYFPASLFMILMTGYALLHVKEHFSWGKKAITAYLVIALVCFFIFFPLISGLPVSREYGYSVRWLKDWILVL